MRRLMPIAACAVLLALPLWAQHGGGHAGGGHAGGSAGHAGFSGGHGGGFSGGHTSGGGHAFSGARSGSGASRGLAPRPSYSRPSYSRPASRPFSSPQYQRGLNEEILAQRRLNPQAFSRPPVGRNRFRGGRFQTYGFLNNCYGYACRGYYPWAYGAYYDPFWWGDSGSSYNNDEDYDQDVAAAAEMNRQSLEEQEMMRQEQADGDQDLYARQVPARPAIHESDGAPVLPDTVLVFRDEHKQEIRNYAIVGQTLWNFAPLHTQKIPLSDLDLPATAKANDARGLTFRVPASGEAQ